MDAGRHAGQHVDFAPAGSQHRPAAGPGRSRRAGSGRNQTLRHRGPAGCRGQGRPDSRGNGLHARAPRGKALPGCPDHPYLRGHLRDSAKHHRSKPLEGRCLTEATDRLPATETAPPDRPLAWVGAVAPGFVLTVAMAAASRLVSPIVRPVPDVVLALAAGIVIRNSIRATSAEPGAKFVMHYVLRGAIVLIGASLTLQSVA